MRRDNRATVRVRSWNQLRLIAAPDRAIAWFALRKLRPTKSALGIESPARRSVRVFGRDSHRGIWSDLVEIPRSASRAWRAVLRGDRSTARARRPSQRGIEVRHTLQARPAGDLAGGALAHDS